MQTLEEKKAILQRAMDEGLNVRIKDYCSEYVVRALSESYAILWVPDREAPTRLDEHTFEIVKPRITAEDLCEAIEKQEAYRRSQRLYCEDDTALWALTKRYREQESKTTNEAREKHAKELHDEYYRK